MAEETAFSIEKEHDYTTSAEELEGPVDVEEQGTEEKPDQTTDQVKETEEKQETEDKSVSEEDKKKGDAEDKDKQVEDEGDVQENKESGPNIDDLVAEASEGDFTSFDDLVDNYNELIDIEQKYNELQQVVEKYKDLDEDEFLKGFIDHYKATGDPTPYLEAKTVNYDKMSDLQVLERDLRKENPHLSDKAVQIKLRKMSNLLDSKVDTEDLSQEQIEELELEREELKGKASFLRDKWKKDAENFKIPEAKPKDDSQVTEEEQQQQELWENWQSDFEDRVSHSKALKDKKITIDVGDKSEDAFNFDIDNVDKLYKSVVDTNSFFDLLRARDDKGNLVQDPKTGLYQVDVDKHVLVTAFAQDPQGFIKALVNHGKNLGTEEVVKEVKNTAETDQKSEDKEGGVSEKTGFKVEREFD